MSALFVCLYAGIYVCAYLDIVGALTVFTTECWFVLFVYRPIYKFACDKCLCERMRV